jgi:hypothetical protein
MCNITVPARHYISRTSKIPDLALSYILGSCNRSARTSGQIALGAFRSRFLFAQYMQILSSLRFWVMRVSYLYSRGDFRPKSVRHRRFVGDDDASGFPRRLQHLHAHITHDNISSAVRLALIRAWFTFPRPILLRYNNTFACGRCDAKWAY